MAIGGVWAWSIWLGSNELVLYVGTYDEAKSFVQSQHEEWSFTGEPDLARTIHPNTRRGAVLRKPGNKRSIEDAWVGTRLPVES